MKATIARVVDRRDLTGEEMTAAMQAIMGGDATPAQIAGFLVAMRIKGETVTEIAAAAADELARIFQKKKKDISEIISEMQRKDKPS